MMDCRHFSSSSVKMTCRSTPARSDSDNWEQILQNCLLGGAVGISEDAAAKSIGLALSGGGVRAAAFHAGVLKKLAQDQILESVEHVSTVSGGSLFTGLVFSLSGYKWPSSSQYLAETLPCIKIALTKTSLQREAIQRLLLPKNWRYILSRANVLEQTIREVWNIDARLDALSDSPTWSINCTTGETGRRFRFKNKTMGDYETGYASVDGFALSKAMAISAAFPGGIGPLSLSVKNCAWKKRTKWNQGEAQDYLPPFSKFHLYDGGLYDNLGIEPLFDVGKQLIKNDSSLRRPLNWLLVSDGGAPFGRTKIPHPLNPLRFKRIADIALDQTRALRVRSLMNHFTARSGSGAYVGIGMDPRKSISEGTKGNPKLQEELLELAWISAEDAMRAAMYATNLNGMEAADFDLLARHGYETASWAVKISQQ
ncbi:patatin-like phospholipase family protein [Herbaspirillum sp. LeCh32-8]|uniref:patatin-like phospholipase family protein n=1 Tax=Herbaspirillum sp. LeCh32-8 TaxID=2821356 RepID=UPI001AE8771A|nr:patatin-like phospholipase family protein [Herbaspirillum sp. LeCh32-8]MBP0600755.1 patatin-like phospholipase family protein [Herbaspirillum sp. LeCh32-8]